MDLKEIGINTRNWAVSSQSSCECGIEPPGSISQGVSKFIFGAYDLIIYKICLTHAREGNILCLLPCCINDLFEEQLTFYGHALKSDVPGRIEK